MLMWSQYKVTVVGTDNLVRVADNQVKIAKQIGVIVDDIYQNIDGISKKVDKIDEKYLMMINDTGNNISIAEITISIPDSCISTSKDVGAIQAPREF